MTMLEMFKNAKELYNAYRQAKVHYTSGLGQEMSLTGTLAPFLRSLLDIAVEFHKATECETERDLLRQFVAELNKVYMRQ